MTYLAVVNVNNNKITKYQPFATQAEADAHVAEHGGFVFDNNTDHPIDYLSVNNSNNVTLEPIPTKEEKEATRLSLAKDRVVSQFEKSRSVDRVQFKLLFQLTNEVRELKGQQPITAEQFKTFIRNQVD